MFFEGAAVCRVLSFLRFLMQLEFLPKDFVTFHGGDLHSPTLFGCALVFESVLILRYLAVCPVILNKITFVSHVNTDFSMLKGSC